MANKRPFSRLHLRASAALSRLSTRERILLSLVVVTGAIAGANVGVLAPHEKLQADLARETKQAILLTDRLTALNSLGLKPERAEDPRPLPVLAAETAGEYDVVLTRLSERGFEIDLDLSPLPFDRLIRWSHALMNDYGVIVQAIDIKRELEPGTVSARMTLAIRKSEE